MLNEMQILASLQVASDVVTALNLTENPAFLNPPSSLLSQGIAGAKASVRALIPVPETEVGAVGTPDPAAMAEHASSCRPHSGSGPILSFTASGAASWSRSGTPPTIRCSPPIS
jgi:hypothetical protein